MAAPITKLRIGLQPDTPEEHTRLLINVNTEEAQTALRIATDLRVRANPATAKIYYYNFDGSELLYTETIEPGGNGSWDGEPGRPGGEGYSYIFNGWSANPNATEATEGILDGVFTSRKAFAAYLRRDTTGFVVFDGITTLKTITLAKSWNGQLFYSTDAARWAEWNGEEIFADSSKKIFLRGVGNSIITGSRGAQKRFVIAGESGGVACTGSIEFLLDYEQALAGSSPAMRANCFEGLFYGCTGLSTPPTLPATALKSGCYKNMFYGCTGLSTPPELPATTLASSCYESMFYGCTGLSTPPELPATTLASGCYTTMFLDCTGLSTPPELPATTLASGCYTGMFYGCTGLSTPPELPATTLASNCYQNMFYGCAGIKISATQTEFYPNPFRIPPAGEGTDSSDALTSMFANTGGTFTGTPTINTTYYLAPPASA